MGRVTSITLGIITAIGGFVDMGELVTASQAGATYRFSLLWTVVVGTLGIIVFTDMSGRVAIASGRTIFDVIRDRLGFRLALIPLVVSTVVNVLTIVIEIAGMALAFEILSGLSYLWWIPVMGLLVAGILWVASFEFVENTASLLGLVILVFVVAAFKLAPPVGDVARNLVVPSIPAGQDLFAYGFAAIGLLGAFMTPYEIYFYSSGAIEEKWTGKDFVTNRATTFIGYSFGSIIVVAMMVVAAQSFFTHGVQSQLYESIRAPLVATMGSVGLAAFLIGSFAVTSGAAFEATLSTAYTLCQYFGWDWGEEHNPRDAPTFTFLYLGAIVLAVLIAVTGIDPVKLTIYVTALAAFSLPFTFVPLFIIANDEEYMGDQRNGALANIAGGFFLILLSIVTVATLPLFVLSGGGG